MAGRFSAIKQIWNRYKQTLQYVPSLSNTVYLKDSLVSKTISWNGNYASSHFKIKNRCVFTNRSRAVFNKIKLTRMAFKNLATQGLLNGIKKYSW